jgi:hypothetical protein
VWLLCNRLVRSDGHTTKDCRLFERSLFNSEKLLAETLKEVFRSGGLSILVNYQNC